MKKTLLLASLLLILEAFTGRPAQAQSGKSAPAYKLAAVSAQSFDSATNEFTPVTDETEFFNEISLSLFVSLRMDGKPGSYESARRVHISVTQGKKQILSRTDSLGVFSINGHFYAPVWIYGPLCSPVTVKATLLGQKPASSISKTFVFHCGE